VTDFPVRLRHKDGHELECQISAIVRLDKTGQLIGYQGIVHDLTAYKQAEAARQRVWALQDLNQSLEERVEARTLALSEANTALQVEIEQRQSQQQEKEHLLALAQQQSEHLRSMSRWLVEMQKPQRTGLLAEDIQQKMDDIRQNLSLLQGSPGFEQNPSLITYVSDTIRLLTEVEIYVEQVTTSLDETQATGDPLTGNPLLQLSSRERQVLKLTAEGKSNPEIADILTVRLNTVHTYLKRIRHKLDIQDLSGLVKFAKENKIIQ
jgi:DNA-binding CsgD family transcriptional regulator